MSALGQKGCLHASPDFRFTPKSRRWLPSISGDAAPDAEMTVISLRTLFDHAARDATAAQRGGLV
jgi:hypothetical protein